MPPPSTAHDADLSLRLWGVRGSIPTPVAANLGHGGNTPCVSAQAGPDDLLIFDAGSGIRALGAELMQLPTLPTLHLFFTHFHWDHLQGLPFFAPLYRPDAHLILHSAREPAELCDLLSCQMTSPFFPVNFTGLASHVECCQIHNAPVEVAGLTVQAFPLNHPQGAQGYRIANAHKSIVFATDHEHGDAAIDANLRAVARNADVLLYDAQYTPTEYQQRKGWGHSTWLEAVHVARDASVAKLVLFHHDPTHDDAALEAIAAEAQLHFPNTLAAREGSTL